MTRALIGALDRCARDAPTRGDRRELFRAVLGLTEPWRVSQIEIRGVNGQQ